MPETNQLTETLLSVESSGTGTWDIIDDAGEAYCSITNRIVIVSPLPQRIHELIRGLTTACYDVMVFHHGDPALLSRLQADLLIADCTRPGDSTEGSHGFGWLDSPELVGLPVVRLLARDSGRDQAAGADALPWPMPFREALAFIRIRAEAGRSGKGGVASAAIAAASSEDDIRRLHDLVLDLKRHTASRAGARLDLTKTEFELLRVLLEAGGTVLTRQELLDRVWGDDYFGGSNTVDVHVKTLRHKLGDDPKSPRYIVTVRGIGYRAADS